MKTRTIDSDRYLIKSWNSNLKSNDLLRTFMNNDIMNFHFSWFTQVNSDSHTSFVQRWTYTKTDIQEKWTDKNWKKVYQYWLIRPLVHDYEMKNFDMICRTVQKQIIQKFLITRLMISFRFRRILTHDQKERFEIHIKKYWQWITRSQDLTIYPHTAINLTHQKYFFRPKKAIFYDANGYIHNQKRQIPI